MSINQQTKYSRTKRLLAKQQIKDLKVNGCAICGYDKCSRALNFHHAEHGSKKFQINSDTLVKKSLKDLVNELNKCVLLCCNCHMEVEEK